MKKISLIIPTFNRYELCCEAIQNAIDQNDPNFEIIVIDDCSDDNTYGKLKEKNFPNTKIVQTAKNSGPCIARNIGIAHSTGDYIVPLDTDNRLKENALKTIRKVLDSSNYKLYFFRCIDSSTRKLIGLVPQNKTECESFPIHFKEMIAGDISGEFPPVVDSTLFKRENFSFPETFSGGEGILWLNILKAHPGLVVNQVVQTYSQIGQDRLCSRNMQLKNSKLNAKIKDLYLINFKNDLIEMNLQKSVREELFKACWYWMLSGYRINALKRLFSSLRYGIDLKQIVSFLFIPLPTVLVKKVFSYL